MSALRIIAIALATLVAASAAPPQPVFPNPANGAANVPVDAPLFWSLGEQELIVNGGFEAGTLTGWTKENQFGDTIMNNGAYQPTTGIGPQPSYAGTWSTITEQMGPGVVAISQEVTIPTNAQSAVLRWVDRMWNLAGGFFNPPQPQRYYVEARSSAGAFLETLYITETGDNPFSEWTKRSADVRRYAGQRIRIAFAVEVARAPFHLLLDNVSLVVQAGAATRYDVYFGTNSTLGVSNLVATVTNGAWTPPALQPNTTYFWRINTRQGSDTTVGPVWQFRTHPLGFVNHFTWAPIAPQSVGQSFPVALSARDAGNNLVTNVPAFPAPLAVQAFRVDDSSWNLLDAQPHAAFVNHDKTTVGYSFTPEIDIMVTALRRYAGEKISIWNDRGILLASAAASGPAGTWTDLPLARSLGLAAGQTYVIGVYSSGPVTNYARFDALSGFGHGTIDQAFEGNGDAMPTVPHPARWWFVDLVYSPATGGPLDITPDSAFSFPGGVWTGPITFHETAPRVYLRAGSDNLSSMFSVSEMPLRITSVSYDGETAVITFFGATGQSYVLQRSATGLVGSWSSVNLPVSGTGGSMQLTDFEAGNSGLVGFYRLVAE